ncbi:Uu.00g042430.m01.CDS01 [Anthostomella pinea]|uniref:Uu.00g042430.m01.CDS01 n=1 Tax=Anthostomella pinea TaxID=933095 RepID=A0AAI8YE39_9PEZI|nr:Uu.00g042430.m01.CDS01 [Anthostomella pinea]
MASKISTRFLSSALRPTRIISPSTSHPYPRLPRTLQPAFRRSAHSIPKPPHPAPPASNSAQPPASDAKPRKLLEPHYELTFTCVPCGERSSHTISKQGYHKGSVLITCPSCRNRHIISDNLNIFGDRKITVEDIMREKGQLVKRGTLGEDGDVEFWEDGTVTERGTSAAGNATGTATKAINEPGPQAETEEATKMRDARDPSSQATESTPATGSTPLSNAEARPTVDSTLRPNTVPSTRRQYSTAVSRDDQQTGDGHVGGFNYHPIIEESSSQNLLREMMEDSGRTNLHHVLADLRDSLRDGTPLPKRVKQEPPKPRERPVSMSSMFRRVTGERERMGKNQRELLKSGWRSERRRELPLSVLTRVPREEMVKHVKHAKPLIAKSYETTPGDPTVFRKHAVKPASEVIRKLAVKPAPPRVRLVPDREPSVMKEPQVRMAYSKERFNGVRLYALNSADNRPRALQARPGVIGRRPAALSRREGEGEVQPIARPRNDVFRKPKQTARSKRLDAFGKATADLWGNENLSNSLRKMIEHASGAKSLQPLARASF